MLRLLDELPSELIALVLRDVPPRALVRLALANSVWALRLQPLVLQHLVSRRLFEDRAMACKTLDELEQVVVWAWSANLRFMACAA